jgi:transcriptional regulator with XRE-family HTH domain
MGSMTVDSLPAAQIRRTELSTFLRSRRERIDPTALGLPPGTRRRTPGLRREEVAQLAGVGVTWYTWLEQGRRINASTQVLDAIAKTLQLDHTEHEHLYRLADVPGTVTAAVPEADFEPDAQRILDEIDSPACINNDRFDVLAWNKAYRDLFPFRFTGSTRLRNTLWCAFTVPACCNPIQNREQEMPMMLATFRAKYSRHVGEPAWEEFIAELSSTSADFREMWANHDVAGHTTMIKHIRHHAVGDLSFKAVRLQLMATPVNGIVVYLSADEETAAAMRRLAEGQVPIPETLPCGHRHLPGNRAQPAGNALV